MVDIVLALIFFALMGWVTHRLMGRRDNILHYCFIGGAGSGLGSLLEFVTGRYTTTFFGAISLCILSCVVVECVINYLTRRYWPGPSEDPGDDVYEEIP